MSVLLRRFGLRRLRLDVVRLLLAGYQEDIGGNVSVQVLLCFGFLGLLELLDHLLLAHAGRSSQSDLPPVLWSTDVKLEPNGCDISQIPISILDSLFSMICLEKRVTKISDGRQDIYSLKPGMVTG